MNILSLIESATGNIYKRKASTLGGEYSGPCPWCQGVDRFSIHPEQEHFVCRGCKKAGNSITFMMKFHNQKYFEACAGLGITPEMRFKSPNTATEKPGANQLQWKPREITRPPEQWQTKAAAILFESYKYLLSPAGKQHRDWLNARGISNNTIKTARMGWNTVSLTFDPASWGLAPEKTKNGSNKKIWLPEGLIIPYFRDGKPIRLRIRQSNPTTTDRFIMVAGSAMDFLDYNSHSGTQQDLSIPVMVTESELDGWLLHQEVGDICSIYSVGNSSSRPDELTHAIIKHFPILLSLDNDEAGENEIPWWTKQYPTCIPWISEIAKDPGEDFEIGVDIRAWVKRGLSALTCKFPVKSLPKKPESFKSAVLDQAKKPIEKPPTITNPKNPEVPKLPAQPTPFCLHNQYCASFKDNQCLVDQQSPIQTMACPKNQWYAHTTGHITEIILGAGVKKAK